MWVVRNTKNHEIVARGFSDERSASAEALRFINKTWDHYEAYPARLAG